MLRIVVEQAQHLYIGLSFLFVRLPGALKGLTTICICSNKCHGVLVLSTKQGETKERLRNGSQLCTVDEGNMSWRITISRVFSRRERWVAPERCI